MPTATANPETAARDQRVRELIAGGHSLRAIALKLGISPTGAARLVKALGLRVRKVKPGRGIGAITFSADRASLSHVDRKLVHVDRKLVGADGNVAMSIPYPQRRVGS